MPMYMVQASYTAEGVKGLIKDTASGRRAAVKAGIKAAGVFIYSEAPDYHLVGDIDEGFAQGRFQSPSKTGVAYMLAGDVKFDRKSGQLSTVEFPPHYMIYAPGVTNADIGVTGDALKQTPGLPFVYSGYSGNKRTAYIIVPASQGAAHATH